MLLFEMGSQWLLSKVTGYNIGHQLIWKVNGCNEKTLIAMESQ
jgi:hypothetical protein